MQHSPGVPSRRALRALLRVTTPCHAEERAQRASRSTSKRSTRSVQHSPDGPSRRALRALLRVTTSCHAEERAQRASRSSIKTEHAKRATIAQRPFETRTSCAPQGDKALLRVSVCYARWRFMKRLSPTARKNSSVARSTIVAPLELRK